MSDRYKITSYFHRGESWYDVIDTTKPEGEYGRIVKVTQYELEAKNHVNDLLGLPRELTREELKARVVELEARIAALEAELK